MKFLSKKEYERFNILQQKEDAYERRNKEFDLEKQKAGQDLTAKRESIEHDRKMMKEGFDLKEKQVVSAYEDKLSKEITILEKKHAKELTKVKEDLQEKHNVKLEKMMEDHYKKLSSSMTKLHEEGNAQTKHMSDITKEVIKASGLAHAGRTDTTTKHMKIEHVTPEQD